MRPEILLFRALANNPSALLPISEIAEWIRSDQDLDPRLRELAILQVGLSTRDPYIFSHHVVIGMKCGVTEHAIDWMYGRSSTPPGDIDDVDETVVRSARDLCVTDEQQQADFTLLHDALGAAALIDLIAVIGFFTFVHTMIRALEIDVEPEYVDVLRRWPITR